VIFLSDGVGRFRHASSTYLPLSTIKSKALSSDRFVLSQPSTDIWPPPTSPNRWSICTSPCGLISRDLYVRCGLPPAGDLLLFLSIRFDDIPLPIRRGFFEGAFQILPLFRGLSPEGVVRLSLFRMSTLQDSLYGTDCHLAPLSQRHTPAFTLPVTRGHEGLATRLSGNYRDRTLAG